MTIGHGIVVAMPGVPSEMFAMFETQVRPRLVALGLGGGVLVQRKINTFGAGESAVEEKLLDLTRRGHDARSRHHGQPTPSFRSAFIARAATAAEAQTQIAPVERTIRERLGELVFGVEDEDLQDAVARLLAERRKTAGDGREHHRRGWWRTAWPGSRHQPLAPRRHRRLHQ